MQLVLTPDLVKQNLVKLNFQTQLGHASKALINVAMLLTILVYDNIQLRARPTFPLGDCHGLFNRVPIEYYYYITFVLVTSLFSVITFRI